MKAKALYDQQTTGRITKIADNAMRGAQAKITERAQGPGGGLLLGVAGTIGGIADQAAGPSAAVALSDEVPGSRPKASRNPPTLPTKLQLATMIANEEATDRDAVRSTRTFWSHFHTKNRWFCQARLVTITGTVETIRRFFRRRQHSAWAIRTAGAGCQSSRPRQRSRIIFSSTVSKNGLFAPFIYQNENFTKTGSGQT